MVSVQHQFLAQVNVQDDSKRILQPGYDVVLR